MSQQLIITDAANQSVSLTVIPDYVIVRDLKGNEIVNISAPNLLELIRAVIALNPGILNCLHQDIDKVVANNKVLSDCLDTVVKYNNSPNFIGNQEGVNTIIKNAKAQLK